MNIETANRLVSQRKQRGLSQEALSDALGISRQAVSKWERAEASPDTDNLLALARLYGISLDELLGHQPQVAPAPITGDRPFAEVGEAPSYESVAGAIETEVLNEVSGALLEDGVEPTLVNHAQWEGRKPLSPQARRLLDGIGMAAYAVAFIIYGFLSLLFPGLYGAYPVLCTAFYLAVGFFFDGWHPWWMVFLTIPLLYTIF